MALEAIKAYLKSMEVALKAGNATEHTHRPALKVLLEALANDGLVATNEPRKIACGAPDVIISRDLLPVGYVEAKDVGLDLARAERTEQLIRYREALPNLVLTDYFEFRWYVDGEMRLRAELPRPGKDGRIRWNDDAASQLTQLLGQFFCADIPLRATPRELAMRMAKSAELIRSLIEQTFAAEGASGDLHAQLEAFRQVLIESLSVEQFADMYAQTLAYGLFAARCNSNGAGFTRQIAAATLPKTNPFLRKLFHTIAGPDLDDRIAWAVDQLAELLARADMAAILEDFGRRTRREDPVVHFYETFLAAYDPKLREARGVYYTPEPVVNYIVRSVDTLLQRDFRLRDGLADSSKTRRKGLAVEQSVGKRKTTTNIVEKFQDVHRVQILDPAAGTGTFLYAVIQKIRERFEGNAGAWPGYVAEHLLPRLFGFELLMAPYAVAHMKLGLELEQSGYDFASDQRLNVFLTNTLEEAHALTKLPGFTAWLADEANAAAEVKKDAPVMVVLGNPPYSGHSENKGAWIERLMEDYKQSPALKKPAQAKWLSDDYVKFVRFAQWRIEQTGYGVLGFVTNHGYLDNPTFMDMRCSLLRTFDDIYLLDLHGSSKKKEKDPDGGPDENVFDIQQGVAIGLFVRRRNGERAADHCARIRHAHLFGTRAAKYAALDSSSVEDTPWAEISPKAPNWLFVPQDSDLLAEYEAGWSLRDIFAPGGDPAPGIVTTHDEFAISWTREEAAQKVERLLATSTEAEARELFKLCSQDQWRYLRAKSELADGRWREKIVPILYRPFDVRWTVWNANVAVHRRERVNDHMILGPNIALCVGKAGQVVSEDWNVLTCSLAPTDFNLFRRGGNCIFPAWSYSPEVRQHGDDSIYARNSNHNQDFVRSLEESFGDDLSADQIQAYIFAVLYAPSYRIRYAEFLKRDFPCVPLIRNRTLFRALIDIGVELLNLHTMQTTCSRITRYDVTGSNEVVRVRYVESPSRQSGPASETRSLPGRIYINDAQYFDGVSQAAWDFHIGGYRVLEKWLKDRKGRCLSYDDLTHYQAVVAAVARILELQVDLDAAITQAGGWPLR